MDYPKSDYKEYPKTLPPDDFWGQVRRTQYGKRVSEDQIQMIVTAIQQCLGLEPADHLLDLACGNGALSARLFDSCAELLGVDFSEYLVSVAKQNFERLPRYSFLVCDAASYVQQEPRPDRFTRVNCYGSFPFFKSEDARTVLSTLRQKFINIKKVFLGNLPDRERAHLFYPAGKDYSQELDDPAGQVGLWRSKEDMLCLARDTGWTAAFHHMPAAFPWGHYRYDVILEPSARLTIDSSQPVTT